MPTLLLKIPRLKGVAKQYFEHISHSKKRKSHNSNPTCALFTTPDFPGLRGVSALESESYSFILSSHVFGLYCTFPCIFYPLQLENDIPSKEPNSTAKAQ